jgi:hypothetical protein
MAIQTLVAIAGARRQAMAVFQTGQRNPKSRRPGLKIDAERVEMKFSADIRSVGGEEAGFEPYKSQRVVGAQRMAANSTAVVIQAAG